MSDEAAFLRAIQANPADSTAKLVYADWLDEHGERKRAEYVRLVANGKSPHGRAGYWPGVGFAWLDLFHNRAPLWDSVTLLALGRLDGWLAAFAKCSQHSSDIEYHFSANLLPRYGLVQSMVDDWFGEDFQPIRLEQFGDWQAELRQALHANLLIELGRVSSAPSVPDGWDASRLALQEERGRGWIIDAVEEAIQEVIHPTAGWQVHITRSPKVWYAIQWTDIVLEAVDRVLFLHFSFTD